MKKHLLITILLAVSMLTACGSTHEKLPEDNPGPATPPAIDITSEAAITEPKEPEPEDMKDPHWPVAVMYHLIMEEPYSKWDNLFVKPSDFEAHLKKFNEEGFEFIFADEYRIHDGRSVVLTFDDGYADNYTTMFPILKENNACATIFLVEDLIGTNGYMTEDQIREMADSGLVHFGCHTKTHREIPELDEATLVGEFESCSKKVSELTGRSCRSFAYPSGKYNAKCEQITSEHFDFAYTTQGHPPTGWPNMFEIPRVYASRGASAEKMLKLVNTMDSKMPVKLR